MAFTPGWMRRMAKKMKRDYKRLIDRGLLNVVALRLTWDVPGAPAVAADPNVESAAPPATSREQADVKGFVHFVQPVQSGVDRTYAEVETGDVIVDFDDDVVEFSDKDNLRFEIPAGSGRFYVQKRGGTELATYWDLVMGTTFQGRTALLTLTK
jgi:hypothetical protein